MTSTLDAPPRVASPPAWQRASSSRDDSRSAAPRQLGRLMTVIAQQPWFRNGTPEQRRRLAQVASEASQRARNRFARVKAHPDLADRLCRSLGYARFDQWNGFVPPARDPDGRPNNSPVRAELVAILRAVADREQETQ